MATTEKGKEKIGDISARFSTEPVALKTLKNKNSALINSVKIPCRKREVFFANFDNPNLHKIAIRLARKSFFEKISNKIKSIYNKLMLKQE